MAIGDIRIEGLKEVEKALEILRDSLPPDKIEALMLNYAKNVADDMERRAPHGPTGNLIRGIHSKLLSRNNSDQPAPAIAAVDRKIAPHAHLVEFGTQKTREPNKARILYDKDTGMFFGKSVGPMPASPFMRPAWEGLRPAILRDIEAQVRKLVEWR